MSRLPALSPHGRLFLDESEAADAAGTVGLSAETMQRIGDAFAESSARGLLALAVRRGEGGRWPAEFAFWREFADAYLTALAHTPDSADGQAVPEALMPPDLGFDFTLRIPAMRGAEYASPEIFAVLWRELDVLA